jgi:hypothetical protein
LDLAVPIRYPYVRGKGAALEQERTSQQQPAISWISVPRLILITVLVAILLITIVTVYFGKEVLLRDLPFTIAIEAVSIVLTVFWIEDKIRKREQEREEERERFEKEREQEQERREQERERQRWLPARQFMYADLLDSANNFISTIFPNQLLNIADDEEYYFGDISTFSAFTVKFNAEELERLNKELDYDVLRDMWLFLAKDDTKPLLEFRATITSAARSPIPLLEPEIVESMYRLDGQLKRTTATIRLYSSSSANIEVEEQALATSYLELAPSVLRLKSRLEQRASGRTTLSESLYETGQELEDLYNLTKEAWGSDWDKPEHLERSLRDKEQQVENNGKEIERKLKELQENDLDEQTKLQQREHLEELKNANEADKQRLKDYREKLEKAPTLKIEDVVKDVKGSSDLN